ncbi:uncharacterized protein J8A68_002060 [[Candida] subhashii]|uniref:Gfd2/YDR514C-like C-terminal domain-containing protein n=1 Tax=[Candida] subhashii TaxID=561895 RepID=A0A8J5QSC7_9ASCO|nr:uncharacterized protein J8A68_002060 [[Candida] subhashii]KAG7664387.1 hypothetical protein J8A68_002060 [[Candida] subhashii]
MMSHETSNKQDLGISSSPKGRKKNKHHDNTHHSKHPHHHHTNEDRDKHHGSEHGKKGKLPKRPHIPILEIRQEYRHYVSTHLQNLPKFKTLDETVCWNLPVYDYIIDQYAENNSNFRTNPRLANPEAQKQLIESMRNVYGRKSILFCVDVEAWEFNTRIVTEIGIAIYDPREQQMAMMPTIQQIHIRIKENIDKINGKFVPNHANNFNGGVSYVMTKYEAASFIQSLVDYYLHKPKPHNVPSYFVGHDVSGDIKWLNALGVKLPTHFLRLDTAQLFRFSRGKSGISLKNALNVVQIPHAFLHNAGNDAYYTLVLAMTLCDPQCRVRFNLDVMDPSPAKQEDKSKEEGDSTKDEDGKEQSSDLSNEDEDSKMDIEDSNDTKPAEDPKPSPAAIKKERSKRRLEKKKKNIAVANTADCIELYTAIEATLTIFKH